MNRHDPNNKDCPRHGQYAAKSECTCPPATDKDSLLVEVEQIRARHETHDREINEAFCITRARAATHRDRATLLRIVDQLRAENQKLHDALLPGEYNHLEINDHLRAELAAEKAKETECFQPIRDSLKQQLAEKDAEIERVKTDLILSRQLTAWVRVNHPRIADAAILACLEQPK